MICSVIDEGPRVQSISVFKSIICGVFEVNVIDFQHLCSNLN